MQSPRLCLLGERGSAEVTKRQREDSLNQESSPGARAQLTINIQFLLPEAVLSPSLLTDELLLGFHIFLPFLCLHGSTGSSELPLTPEDTSSLPSALAWEEGIPAAPTVDLCQVPGSSLITASSTFFLSGLSSFLLKLALRKLRV